VVALAAAEAEKVTKVGLAQAEAIRSQVEASGGARYQLTRQVAERFAQALETSGVDVVPKVQISGAGADGGGSAVQALMTLLLADKLNLNDDGEGSAADRPAPAAERASGRAGEKWTSGVHVRPASTQGS
jgi:hypothetical protein